MTKILSIIITIIILFAGITLIPANASNAKFYYGDVNRDGKVDAVDASLILFYYSTISSGKKIENDIQISTLAADVNHDAKIDSVDASIVMKNYAMASAYGIIRFEEIDASDVVFSKNDVVKLNEFTKWAVFTKKEIAPENLYTKKPYLLKSENFVVAKQYSNDWYGIFLENNFQEELYININNECLKYFEKIGSITKPIATTTLITTTTTSTTTSSSTTTTTITTSIPSTTTTITAEPKYSNWQCVNFSGISWNIRSSTTIDIDNVVGSIKNQENFYIKRDLANNWYEICTKNIYENNYILIEPTNQYLFTSANTDNYYFIGEQWNIRNEKNLNDNNNIVGQLEYGDIVSVLDYYADGWARIKTNNVKGHNELYVVLQPFVKLS